MGLRVAVELDPSGVQSGASIVKKELTKADQALDKTKQKFYSAEDAVDAFAAAQISAGRTINDQSQILNSQGKVLAGATTRYAGLTSQVDKLEKEIESFNPIMHQMTESVVQVEKKGKNFSSTFRQMEYQVQEFTTGVAIVKKELINTGQSLDKTKQKFYGAEDAADAFASAQRSAGRSINDQNQILNVQDKVLSGATDRYAELTAQVDKFEKEIKTSSLTMPQMTEGISSVEKKSKNLDSAIIQKDLRVAVELDTIGVTSGTSVVKKELTKADQALDKTKQKFYSAEDAVDAFASAQVAAGRTINDQSQILNAQGKVITGATTRYAALTAQVDKFEKEIKTFNPALHQTGERIDKLDKKGRNFNGTAYQMGYQIQDLSQQLGNTFGGGSPAAAAVMQLSGMAQAFNPIAGAVVGVAGVLGMQLVPALFDTGNEAETVSDKLDKATRAMEVNADGTFTLGDDLQRLNRINTALGDSFLRTANIQATVAAKAANKEMFGALTDTLPLNYVGAALTGNIRLTDGATKSAARFQSILLEGQKAGKLSTDQTLELNMLMGQLAPLTDKATKNHLAISEAITKNALAQSELNDLMKFTSQTQTELNASGSNTVVIEERKTAAKVALTAATRADNEAKKAALQIDKDTMSMVAEDEQRNVQITQQVSTIETGLMNPLERLAEQEEQKRLIIESARMADVISEEHYQNLLTSISKQGETDRAKLASISSQKELQIASSAFSSLSSMAEQFAGDQDNRNKTAFALQKGFALASAGVNLGLAISQALALPADVTIWQKMASYGAVAGAAGAAINSISSQNYATGGFVSGAGTGQSDSISANLGAGEFVMNARATSRNRGALESMNSGSMSGVSSGGSPVVNVNIQTLPGTTADVTTNSNGDLDVRIREIVNNSVPGIIGNEMNNPNSPGRRSLNSNYRMQRA